MWNLWQEMVESFVFTLSKLGKREGVCNFVQSKKLLLEVGVTMLFPGSFEEDHEIPSAIALSVWAEVPGSDWANFLWLQLLEYMFKKELDLNLVTSLSQYDLSHSSSIYFVYRNFVIYKWAGIFITFCINEPLSVFLIGWLLAGWLAL